MKKIIHLIPLLFSIATLAGCQRVEQQAEPVVMTPAHAMPLKDVPPSPDKKDAYQEKSVKPPYKSAVQNEDKASLIYQAKLDLLRISICSDERVESRDKTYSTDEMLQKVIEYFTDIGFRVVDGSPCPSYSSSAEILNKIASERDVDMFVLLSVTAKEADKVGDFYSYEANGRGKVAQVSDRELLTTKSALVRGKRALNEQQAAESALNECGEELAKKLSDEIVRKSGRGTLLRRVRIDGLSKAEDVDYVKIGLLKKPGIQSVTLIGWNKQTERAVFWVRFDASVKGNLAAYLEELGNIRLKVESLEKAGVGSRKKGLLEY
jgi:hypothetical protein